MSGPQTNLVGPVRAVVGEYDGQIWMSASHFIPDGGTWTLTRGAAGNWFRRKTANAETVHIAANITSYFLKKIGADPMTDFGSNLGVVNPPPAPGTIPKSAPSPGTYPFGVGHNFRGLQITSLTPVYAVGTLALTSLAATISQRKLANNAAPVITDKTPLFTGAGAIVKAVQAQPYVTALPCTAPYIIGNNDAGTDDWFELAIVDPGTSVFDLYGVFLGINYNLL